MENLLAIRVRYLGPTNTKGSRVKLEVPRFNIKKTIPYNDTIRRSEDNALSWLKEKGIEPFGECTDKKHESILVASFDYADKILKAFGKGKVK
jgi:hypothetical protein